MTTDKLQKMYFQSMMQVLLEIVASYDLGDESLQMKISSLRLNIMNLKEQDMDKFNKKDYGGAQRASDELTATMTTGWKSEWGNASAADEYQGGLMFNLDVSRRVLLQITDIRAFFCLDLYEIIQVEDTKSLKKICFAFATTTNRLWSSPSRN
ncbi:hypothetical protein pipiens_011712 [Culex pipiens pipiens]|uniref:Uncharacterized protein n=2 Tax=Culex pipiens pipiens TaxID=38569 RepID=A0ABD1D574_CULPP